MTGKQVSIKDVADVLPGMSLQGRAEHDPEGSYQIIMAKHLIEGQNYRFTDSDMLLMTPARMAEKYEVREGDVLFNSRGLRNYAVLVESVPENTIASGTLYIIRPKKNIEPGYLAWCINQAATQAAIAQARTGAGTPIVQRNTFVELEIPLPSIEMQKTITKLSDLMMKEQDLKKAIYEKTLEYHRILGSKLLEKLKGNKHGFN